MSVIDFEKKYVPWDEPIEVFVWLVAVLITTFFVHNVMRAYRENRE